MKAASSLVLVLLLTVTLTSTTWAQKPGKPDSSKKGGSGGACVETPEKVAVDGSTPLGVSGADVLADVGGEFAATLEWREGTMYADFSLGGEQTELVVELKHDGKDVTFIDSTGGGCPPNDLMGAPCVACEPRMELGVVVTLKTQDGALAGEALTGTLTTRGQGGRLTAEAPVSAVAGTYLQELEAQPGRAPAVVALEATWAGPVPGAQRYNDAGWNGFVAITLEGSAGSPVMVAHGYWSAR